VNTLWRVLSKKTQAKLCKCIYCINTQAKAEKEMKKYNKGRGNWQWKNTGPDSKERGWS